MEHNNLNINVLTIKSFAFNFCTQLTNISYNNSDITSIENYVFAYSGITTINITNNLSNIGIASYAYCNIANITNNGNNTKFYIDTINTNQKVLYFKNGTNTSQLYIATNNISGEYKILNPFSGSNTITICDFAFAGCNKLTKINLDNVKSYLTQINSNAFINCINLNNFDFTVLSELQIIDKQSFLNCTSLQTIDLSKNTKLTTINDSAFFNCIITTITIPSSVTTVGMNPFAKCPLINIINNSSSLYLHDLGNNQKILYSKTDLLTTTNNINEEYTVLNGIYNGYKIYINYISNATFYNCINLNSINLSNCKYLLSINSYAFFNCNITILNIPSTLQRINLGSFAKCPITQIINNSPYFYLDNNNVLYNSTNLIMATKNISNTYNLLNGIYNNFSINITYINDYAFYNCVNLTNINLLTTSNISGIGGNAFEKCTNITSLIFPETINYINNKALANMTNLNTITFLGKPPQIVGFDFYTSNTSYIDLYNIIHGITNIPYNIESIINILFNLNTVINDSIYTNISTYILFASNDINNIFYNDNNLTVIYYTSQYATYWIPRPSLISANIQLLELNQNNNVQIYYNKTSFNSIIIQNNHIYKLKRYINGKANNTIIKPFYLQNLTPLLYVFIPPK